jgi:hypothetical protein
LRFLTRRSDAPPKLPSIVEFLRDHVRSDGLGFEPDGITLPDDDRAARIRFTHGALDNVYWRHFGGNRAAPDAGQTARRIHRALRTYAAQPSAKAEAEFKKSLAVSSARELGGAVTEILEREPITNRSVAHAAIRQLAETTGEREILKLCLLLLGSFGDETDNSLLKLVGMYGDFTPFAAAGIAKVNADPARILLELAPTTQGWGRVTIIEALLRHRTAAVSEYLLRTGFDGLMPELAAEVTWQVAVECGLLEAISAPSPDVELVRGVGTILEVLAKSPFKDLGDYEHAPAATAAFLRRFDPLATTILDFETVATLHDRAAIEPGGRHTALPWSAEERADVVKLARAILDRPNWRSDVVAAFDDPALRYSAVHLAKRFGLPYRERLIAWLREDPIRSGWWYQLCEKPTGEQIDEVLALADEILAVDEIATGPADELGLGAGFERDSSVGYILQALRGIASMGGRPAQPGFPGRGENVIHAALGSPVVRNRRVAMAALEGWSPGSLTPRLHAAVQALAADPNAGARDQAVALLAKLGRPRIQ